MSELQNPLFDEEKEFLERKKLEYERALRGDVDHIKDQSVMVGKVAAVGVGLVGGIWLITKVFGGKKRKKRRFGPDYDEADHGSDADAEAEYYTAGNGKRYQSKTTHKSAVDSARAFVEHHEQAHEADDLGFGSKAATPSQHADGAYAAPHSAFGPESFEDDPFQDLPYDDEDGPAPAARPASSRSRMIGTVLQTFLQSDTGKVLVAQVAAVALALVTKKVGEIFPAAKNADLATPPGHGNAPAGESPIASSTTSAPSDASKLP